jgi:hypothetical protein
MSKLQSPVHGARPYCLSKALKVSIVIAIALRLELPIIRTTVILKANLQPVGTG